MVALLSAPASMLRRNGSRRVAESVELSREDAWELTRAISPRPTVRVASVDATGVIENRYPIEAETAGPSPDSTWAMNLTGRDHLFRYLVFDLDVKNGNVGRDRDRLCHWLIDLNIDYLVARSGPEGGLHVWVALDEPTSAQTVKDIAQLGSQLLPTLDVKPLTNPSAGCVRPPGAPHRIGGSSQIINGDVGVLHRHDTLPEQIDALREMFIDLGATLEPENIVPMHGVRLDDDGLPYLTGPRRGLTPRILDLLEDPSLDGDLSYRMATVLAAFANARFRLSDVIDEYGHSPAFEHARTVRHSKTVRRPRSAEQQSKVFRGMWHRAVEFVAANPATRLSDDPDVHRRLYDTAKSVERALDRADAMPGYWGADRAGNAARHTKRTTYRQRAVFDTVLLFMLQGATTTVEADQRRIALQTGYGRTTVNVALRELTTPRDPADPESAWLVRVGHSEGRAAQKYRLPSRFSTGEDVGSRTQVLARPAPSGLPAADLRRILMNRILATTTPLATDTFAAPGSYGRTAGLIYAMLPEDGAQTARETARRAGISWAAAVGHLERLSHANLARRLPDGTWRRGRASLHAVAIHLEVADYLADREARYTTDRHVWAWWCAEERWMSQNRFKKGRKRRSSPAIALFAVKTGNDWPRYPRDGAGRGDHRAARQIIEAGLGSVLTLAA